MGTFIKLKDKSRKETPFIGSIKSIDPSPVWVGWKEHSTIKRYMPSSKAEEWSKQSPENRLKLKCKKYELDEL